MRPIDADAFDELLNRLCGPVFSIDDVMEKSNIISVRQLLREQPTLDATSAIHASWISVDDALPVMQANGEKGCIVYNGKRVMFLIYERATVRGKTVYRWKYPWNRIYDYPKITHWMPLPEPPLEDVSKGDNNT